MASTTMKSNWCGCISANSNAKCWNAHHSLCSGLHFKHVQLESMQEFYYTCMMQRCNEWRRKHFFRSGNDILVILATIRTSRHRFSHILPLKCHIFALFLHYYIQINCTLPTLHRPNQYPIITITYLQWTKKKKQILRLNGFRWNRKWFSLKF